MSNSSVVVKNWVRRALDFVFGMAECDFSWRLSVAYGLQCAGRLVNSKFQHQEMPRPAPERKVPGKGRQSVLFYGGRNATISGLLSRDKSVPKARLVSGRAV